MFRLILSIENADLLNFLGSLIRMRDDERFSQLIGRIYDAALDASLWPAVLGDIAHFVGGPAAALFYKNASSKTGEVAYDNGFLDPGYKALYFSDYVKLDPATTGHFFAEMGTPVSTADVIDYDEFLTTRFYRGCGRAAEPRRFRQCDA